MTKLSVIASEIRSYLVARAEEDAHVQSALDGLDALTSATSVSQERQVWANLKPTLELLVQHGVLDQRRVDELANHVTNAEHDSAPEDDVGEFKQVVQQFLSQLEAQNSGIPFSLIPGLPLELQELADSAFALRALTLRPGRVLPPGKGLLSLFMREPDQRSEQERKRTAEVTATIKRAFWDAALEQLASPEMKDQIPRLKVFYTDLFNSLRPFVPRTHPIMVSLSSPLSPTSYPLRSALRYLRATLVLMRSLCATARDQMVDEALAKLQAAEEASLPHRELAHAYIEGIKVALELGEILVDDYHNAMAKFGDESNARAILAASARAHERELISSAYGGIAELRTQWKAWTNGGDWKARLFDIIVPLDPLMQADVKTLHPILRLSKVDIAEVQTLFHGLLIAATIRTLVPPLNAGIRARLASTNEEQFRIESRFTETLWTLLGADPSTKTQDTRLEDVENITEEVLRLWRLRHPGEENKATSLRDMVHKMVNEEQHPVRQLLQKRLVAALLERLQHQDTPDPRTAPTKLMSGRAPPGTLKLRASAPLPINRPEPELIVLGFDDPVFKKVLTQILSLLRINIYWTETTWKDVVIGS